MKKFFLIFFSFIVISCGQNSKRLQYELNNKIVIGTIDSLYSKTLKEERKIWMYVPNGNNSVFSIQKYPVVYLLDGDDHFYSVVGMIQQLGNSIWPEMIVVGIPNTDRTRDLTPTHVEKSINLDSNFVKTSGGGENFITFIEKELIPHIDSLYPVAPYRLFIGHSFGGLTVINTLIHYTDLFNSYVAIDPSMWWDDQKLIKQADTILQKNNFNKKALFLSIANTMQQGMDTVRVRNDTAKSSAHIRSILKFKDDLIRFAPEGLNWSYKYYDGDDHGSVPLISEYDALHFIFSFYRFSDAGKVFEASLSADSSIALFKSHYHKISEHMGYEIRPDEQTINNFGYGFLFDKKFEKAYAFFKMNIDNYPESFNTFDSMGDYYVAKEDTVNAIDFYSKALAIKEFPQTRQKLEKLKKGK